MMAQKRPQGGGRPAWTVDEATSRRLARVRQRGTSPEQQVRLLLREMGVSVRSTKRRLPGSPDIVSIKDRWAVQVHGCFWHQHPGCVRASMPKRNRALWKQKFAGNLERDRRLAAKLREVGFRLLVVWECEVEERPALVASKLRQFIAGQGR
jgi:DNA mismatch endonuclease (patch repair protein)